MMIPGRSLEVRAFDAGGSGRSWTAPLYFEVEVEQTKRSRPNKATIKLHNLSPGSIAWLETEAKLIEVVSSEALLYRGNPRKVRSQVSLPDLTTEITCADGGTAYRDATLSRSYSPGITSTQVLVDLAAALGMGIEKLGTVDEVVFESGHFVAGKVRDAIDELATSCGVTWSIQDGVLQLLGADAPKTGGPLLKAGSGLVGSPERGDKGISVKTLLMPTLKPGKLFKLESRLITGWYRVTRSVHKASSDGMTWESSVEAKEP
jgi:hypothetical protein